jgi:hypothetical protein
MNKLLTFLAIGLAAYCWLHGADAEGYVLAGLSAIGAGKFSPTKAGKSITLTSGGAYMIPSGQYMLFLGRYSFLQFWDPIVNIWRNCQTGVNASAFPVISDGANFRLANLTGTVVGAVVTNGGTGYTNGIYYPTGYPIANNPNAVVQAGTAAAPSATVAAGGGTVLGLFNVVVGGSINTTVTITTAGTNYTKAPTLVVSNPPAGGVPATMTCTISGGAINAVTVRNEGAGYITAPTVTVVNDPDDTTGAGGVLTVNATLTNSGKIIALTPAQYGAGMTSVPAITFAPASTTAATAIMCFTATTVTWTGPNHGTNGNFGMIGSTITAGSSITTNPVITTDAFIPRLGYTAMSTATSPTTTTIVDGGLHQVVPNAVLISNSDGTINAATTTTIAQGGVQDTSYLLPI